MGSRIKTLFLIILIILYWHSESCAATCNSTTCVGSAPWTAASPSYADVNHCVNTCAAKNDTINVPAGSAVWNQQLVIQKAVNLIGSGSGNTVITSTYQAPTTNSTDPRTCLISYSANLESNPENINFRISGFSFDLSNKSGFIFLNYDSILPIRKLRIDNNILKNTIGYRTIYNWGQIWGLIDNNVFDNIGSATGIYGSNLTSWSNFTFHFGTADNMYVEDNTFINMQDTPHSGGAGGRYSIRYNTYSMSSRGLYPWFDSHGNQGEGANYSGMGLEIYGNKLTHSYPNAGVGIVDHRGGRGLIFNNTVIANTSMSAQLREEYADSLNLPASGPDGQPQHVSDSYYWNNRKNNSTYISFSVTQDTSNGVSPNSPAVLAANREFWQFNSSFNGTVGIGCGALSTRPATCTTGVAYWATEQSCTTIDEANVGANPKTPISGTLYKCTAPNTWTEYFIPYTYPHPLRSEIDPVEVTIVK